MQAGVVTRNIIENLMTVDAVAETGIIFPIVYRRRTARTTLRAIEGKVDHRVEAALIEVARIAMTPSETFSGHPEIIGPVFGIFIGAVAAAPCLKGALTSVFELIPARKLHVLGGVATESVDSEVFHPCGEPIDDVVGGSTLAADTPVVDVGQAVVVVVAALLSVPLALQEGGDIDRLCALGHYVGQSGQRHGPVVASGHHIACRCAPRTVTEGSYPRAPPVAPFTLCVGVEAYVVVTPHREFVARGEPAGRNRAVDIAEAIVETVVECAVSGMVEHNVHHHTYSAAVRLGHEIAHILDCAHIAVHVGPVERVIAVECVVGEGIVLAPGPTVHLLVRSGDPDCVHTKIVEIIELFGEALDVAAVECRHI